MTYGDNVSDLLEVRTSQKRPVSGDVSQKEVPLFLSPSFDGLLSGRHDATRFPLPGNFYFIVPVFEPGVCGLRHLNFESKQTSSPLTRCQALCLSDVESE